MAARHCPAGIFLCAGCSVSGPGIGSRQGRRAAGSRVRRLPVPLAGQDPAAARFGRPARDAGQRLRVPSQHQEQASGATGCHRQPRLCQGALRRQAGADRGRPCSRRGRRLRLHPLRGAAADACGRLQADGRRGGARPRGRGPGSGLRDVPSRPHRGRPGVGNPQGTGLSHCRVLDVEQVKGAADIRGGARQEGAPALDREGGQRHQNQPAGGRRRGWEEEQLVGRK